MFNGVGRLSRDWVVRTGHQLFPSQKIDELRQRAWHKVFREAYAQSLSHLPSDNPHRAAFEKTFHIVDGRFEEDYLKARTFLCQVLTLPDIADPERPSSEEADKLLHYNKRLASLLDELQDNADGAFSLPALRAAYYDLKGLNPLTCSNVIRATFVSALLGNIKNDNPFHGAPVHPREVGISAIVLMEAEKKYAHNKIDVEERAIILISLDIHDLLHDGTTNKDKNGRHVPCRLETIAYEGAEPFLAPFELKSFMISQIRTTVMSTEASVDPALPLQLDGSPSPSRARLAGRMYRFYNNELQEQPVLPEDMHPLYDTKRGQSAAFTSTLVDCADVMVSFLGFESFRMRCMQLNQEIKNAKATGILAPDFKNPYPADPTLKDYKGFLNYIMAGTYQAGEGVLPRPSLAGARILLGSSIKNTFAPAPAAEASPVRVP